MKTKWIVADHVELPYTQTTDSFKCDVSVDVVCLLKWIYKISSMWSVTIGLRNTLFSTSFSKEAQQQFVFMWI